IRSDLADKIGPFRTQVEGVVLDEAGSRFAVNDRRSLVPGSGNSTLLLNDTHQRFAAQFAYLGHKISSVPFDAVIYRVQNPDSISWTEKVYEKETRTLRQFVGSIRRTRLINPRLKREFMLE